MDYDLFVSAQWGLLSGNAGGAGRPGASSGDLKVVGGCSGNLQGISALVRDMPAQEAIARLRGIRCGFKPTSCPDQLAQGLEKILQQQ